MPGKYWLAMRYLAILCIILTSTVCFTVAGNCECGKLLMCDGNEYKAVQFEVPIGSKSNPGYSCKDIMDNGEQTADGVYYITLTDRRETFPVYCDMANGGWTMVFKAVTGANQRAQNAYKSGNTYAESEKDALDLTKKYPNDYKNRIVLRWGEFNPSEARVVLYKGGNAVKELKFNAKGSDKLNWFRFEKLTKTYPSWNDLATAHRNIFTIDGPHEHSFFINSVYAGCPGDVGWMVITGPGCDWEKKHPQNAVLYSSLSGRTNWNHYGNVGVADSLVVFLR